METQIVGNNKLDSIAIASLPNNVTEQFSSLMSYLNRLDEFQDTVISLLPFASDEEIAEIRLRGFALGHAGWRVVCACDAETIGRAMALKGGRGKKDTEGQGKLSAAKERGKQGGYTDKNARRNAQLFNTFKTVLIDQHSLLDEKGFYEQALRTPQPRKTIKKFEKEKESNPNFSVTDAARLAKLLREGRKQVVIPDRPDYIDPGFKQLLLDLDASLSAFYNRCQRPEFKIRIASWKRAVRFELGRTPQRDYEAVRAEVDKLCCTVEEIAEEVYLSNKEIIKLCEMIVDKEKETYEFRPVGVNTEMARGGRSVGIFRCDSPHYEGNNYAPTVDWE
jgi:hypothetical protein